MDNHRLLSSDYGGKPTHTFQQLIHLLGIFTNKAGWMKRINVGFIKSYGET